MEIILNDEYKVLISGKNLGYIGEMNSRTITFENYLCEGADRYIMRLVYPDDVAYDVDISSGKYTVEASLLRDFKYCNAQILAVKSSGDNYIYVKKSNIFAFMISKSLDGSVEPIPTYEMAKSELEKVLDVEVKADNVIKNLNATGLLARVQTSTGAYRDTAGTPKAGDTIYLRFVSCSSSIVKNLIAYGRTTDDTAFEPIGKIDNADLPSQLYKFKLEKDYKYIQIGINRFNNTVSFEADYLLSDGSGVLPAIEDIQDKQVSIENQTCRIFRKVVCVGDSYTAGHIQTGSTQYTRNEMYAYPHYMELITGNEWVNCGASGTTVLTWQTHQNGLAKAQKSGVAQAYVIGLGLNDSRNSAVPVGTANDIGTDNETYYGGLSKIVRELNAISPNAKIFINTCPKDDPERFDPYNEAVRTIASTYHDTYHTYCIDLAAVKDKYKIPSITGDTINGHQTAIGYHQFATIYNQILSDFINANISEFQDVYLLQADTFDERAQIVQNKADITDLKSNKVDKVDGKGLSTNDYTTADKSQVEKNKADISSLQSNKVDKVAGKGLSTNDLTNELKTSYDKAVEQTETNKADIAELSDKKITKFYANNLGEITLNDSDSARIQDMIIYGKSLQDGEPTPDNPVDIQSVVKPSICVLGKNFYTHKVKETSIYDVAVKREGSYITLNGTATDSGPEYEKNANTFYIPKGIYTVSYKIISGNLNGTEDDLLKFYCYFSDGSSNYYNLILSGKQNSMNIVVTKDSKSSIIARVCIGSEYNNVKMLVQVERSESPTDLEEYKSTTVTLPYTLNAIPVSSGGNVIIDGQQYIADYVDIEQGEIHKLVDSSLFNTTVSIIDNTDLLLPTKEVVSLTDEELQALKDLKTHYPVTNVLVTSEQLNGYTTFNYAISMANGWNYVKAQLGDTRDYIYDMELQTAEAYVNSEYAVALAELGTEV